METKKEIEKFTKFFDHTLLSPDSTYEDIKQICKEAEYYKTASVCIPPNFVSKARKWYPNLNICTVVGFPLGYTTTDSKIFEAKNAIENGANEIDMVISNRDVKAGKYNEILKEINLIKKAISTNILKVIVEISLLTDEEIINLCKVINESNADFIKTSTGFVNHGATTKAVELITKHISSNKKIKAAGGISTFEDIENFLALNCERLGTSKGISILINHFDK